MQKPSDCESLGACNWPYHLNKFWGLKRKSVSMHPNLHGALLAEHVLSVAL